MGKRLIERQLRQASDKLRRYREELQVIDAQLDHLRDDAGDLEVRAVVSDGSAAGYEHRQAQSHAEAMAEHRRHVLSSISELERKQDQLLDRLGA